MIWVDSSPGSATYYQCDLSIFLDFLRLTLQFYCLHNAFYFRNYHILLSLCWWYAFSSLHPSAKQEFEVLKSSGALSPVVRTEPVPRKHSTMADKHFVERTAVSIYPCYECYLQRTEKQLSCVPSESLYFYTVRPAWCCGQNSVLRVGWLKFSSLQCY